MSTALLSGLIILVLLVIMLIAGVPIAVAVSYTHLDVYKRQVKACLLIHYINKIIHKGTEEISLAELQHPFWGVL